MNNVEIPEVSAEIALQRYHVPSGEPRYAASWCRAGSTGDWSEAHWARQEGASQTARALQLNPDLSYIVFSDDGKPIRRGSESLHDAALADIRGDNVLQKIERQTSSIFSSAPGLDLGTLNGLHYEAIRIRPLDPEVKGDLAVLYNRFQEGSSSDGAWECAIRAENESKGYAIILGPIGSAGDLQEEVRIRWDAATGRWVSSKGDAGEHFRLLQGPETGESLKRILMEGGLKYPVKTLVKDDTESPVTNPGAPNIPVDELSKPYQPVSRSSMGDEQLFAFMSSSRSAAYDYARDKLALATKVDGFWTSPARQAALDYVRRNRPPALNQRSLLEWETSETTSAPEEGDLSFFDAPSGCFSPGGDMIHHLHCSRSGSYIYYLERIGYWYLIPPTEMRERYEVRELALSYTQARHIFQVAYWMTQIRTRALAGDSSVGPEFWSGGSTSDGTASVEITAPGFAFSLSGMRADHYYNAKYLGTGVLDSSYDPSAFLNLVGQLLRREVPAALGDAWAKQRSPYRPGSHYAPAPQPASEIGRFKATGSRLLDLYEKGEVPFGVVLPLMTAAGEMGWRDWIPRLERIFASLPPPTAYERRLEELDAKIQVWRDKLGAEASATAHDQRALKKITPLVDPSQPLAGLQAVDPPPPPPASPSEDPRFVEVDALYETRSAAGAGVSKADEDLATVRSSLPAILKQLRIYDDSEALLSWGFNDELYQHFAIARLAKLAPVQATKLLKICEDRADREEVKQLYADARKALEQTTPEAHSKSSAEKLLRVLLDDTAGADAREQALQTLAASAVQRAGNPRLAQAVLQLLERGAKGRDALPPRLPIVATKILGQNAWEPLTRFTQGLDENGYPRLGTSLPAFLNLAQTYPKNFRQKWIELASAELAHSYRYLEEIVWYSWLLDASECRSLFARIATGGPNDYESVGRSESGSNEAPESRYHFPRQICAIWDEQDALTRARLLVAFAAAHPGRFVEKSDVATSARQKLLAQIGGIARKLSPPERSRLQESINWCAAHAGEVMINQIVPEELEILMHDVRSKCPAN